jgi:hypothetical protein
MEEKKEIKNRFEIVEVPTQVGLAFQDNKDGKVLDVNELLLRIANDIEEVKKGLVG